MFDHVTADKLQMFKIKGSKVKVTTDVRYQQLKLYKSVTDRLTDFKLGESQC